MANGVLFRYKEFLPITAATPMVSMGEGSTPLVRSVKIGQELGADLYFKLEGCNPTGSFKDRGMVVAVAKAVEVGSNAIMCASTGNTSASAAAYGARCGLQTVVIVPKGKISRGKLAQAIVYGARIVTIDGNFDQALKIVRQLTASHPITLVNSVNPHRIEGQKTAAFEIIDDLGDAPDYLVIPVGNAGNITAYWKGFKEWYASGRAKRRPKMTGFQAEGAAPIVRGQPVMKPRTVASAIRIGNPATWQGATNARDESGGTIDMVSDEEILHAYRLMATREGVFGEPASATPVAGLLKMARQGISFAGKRIVCVVTGSGLKDPDTAIKQSEAATIELPADADAVASALGWK